MGLLSKLTGGNDAAGVTIPDGATLYLADPNAPEKPIADYTMAFVVHEDLDRTVLLKNDEQIHLPEGTVMQLAGEGQTMHTNGSRLTIAPAWLVHPNDADKVETRVLEIPGDMAGKTVAEQAPTNPDVLQRAVAGFAAVEHARA